MPVTGVDWVVFGDDWGGHPSTTQHLILHLPPEDRVIWVDSIGMRSPSLTRQDFRRIVEKARAILRQDTTSPDAALYRGTVGRVANVRPRALPWHDRGIAVRFNRWSLGRSIAAEARRHGMRPTVLLASYPVIVRYLEAIPHERLCYLRLDDYAHYPGVDRSLVEATEARMHDLADAVFATARSLIPDEVADKTHYLPQGVQIDHFASVPLEPPDTRVLGFFGTLATWLDFKLIEDVARGAPEWTLEFLGQVDHLPPALARLPNVRLVPRVRFAELPDAISHWRAAWIPFALNTLTIGVNPLKAREYLAAGFPTHCTPLPEADDLRERIRISSDANEVIGWLRSDVLADTREARLRRRESVSGDSWAARAERLREIATRSIESSNMVKMGASG